jgi:SAM-dependent methyltransferase
LFRRKRARDPALPTVAEKNRAEWGARQAQSLWQSLYGPMGAVVDGRTVLDLGCSWGYMLRFLAEEFTPQKLIGTDPGGAWARGDHGWDWLALGDLVEFHRGDLAAIETIGTGTVDLIMCTSVLQYMKPEGVEDNLARCYELLRPGGEMMLRTRCFTSSLGADLHRLAEPQYVHLLHGEDDLRAWVREHHDRATPYLNWLTATTYLTMFVRAGFEVAEVRRRMNSREPEVIERVARELPWIDANERNVAELEARLIRPITADDLGALGDSIGGHVADGPRITR